MDERPTAPVRDGCYKLAAFVADEAHGTFVAAAKLHGKQTREGGKISQMTKIWNDVHALRGQGWA